MTTLEKKTHLTLLPRKLPSKTKIFQRYVKTILSIFSIQHRLREKQRRKASPDFESSFLDLILYFTYIQNCFYVKLC